MKHLLRDNWPGLGIKWKYEYFLREAREMSRDFLEDIWQQSETFWKLDINPFYEEEKLSCDLSGGSFVVEKIKFWFLPVLCYSSVILWYSTCHEIYGNFSAFCDARQCYTLYIFGCLKNARKNNCI